MIGVADHYDLPPFFRLLPHNGMNAFNERTRSVNDVRMTGAQLFIHRSRYAVGADDDPLPLRQLRRAFDDGKSLFLQRGNGVAVMNQLAETAARTVLQRILRHADGALHAETEPGAAGKNVRRHAPYSSGLSAQMRSISSSAQRS